MSAVTRGLGPDSLKPRCSNEEEVGIVTGLIFICCLCIMAKPPPRLSRRGLSIYVYPGGVVWLSEM